jgi:hypothetical protein
MIELMVAEDAEADPADVRIRVRDPSLADIESVLRPAEDVWYGTHYVLRGEGIDLVAISTRGPVLRPNDPGEFLLYSGGRLVKERALRQEVLDVFSAAALR